MSSSDDAAGTDDFVEHPEHDDDERDDEHADGPVQRLSLGRVAVVVVAVVGLAGLGFAVFRDSSAAEPPPISWSVPYVDVTLTPTLAFQDPQANPARDVALAFVVADPDDPCTPTWGGAYSLAEAGEQLQLDRRIAALRAGGGDALISFGGQANRELAFACADQAALTDAYRSVVERYDVRVIDLDIEGDALGDPASIDRRSRAVAAIQNERRSAGEELAVWLTLPVAVNGLTPEGVDVVASALAAGIDLTGVNVMTMNFGSDSAPTTDMLAATTSALEATVAQVGRLYEDEGIELDAIERWGKVGATPMLGQNDVKGEVFTLADARGLADLAIAKGLGRVSTWSLNRDGPCPASFADVTVLSNTCSGVRQEPLEFTNVFTMLPGRGPDAEAEVAVVVPDQRGSGGEPANSPFPIWRPNAQYVEGYKVVRGGLVYQSKWYTIGEDPAQGVLRPWDTPWTLLGPVQPSDVPLSPSTVPPGTHPNWDPERLWQKGEAVLYDGLPYEARWTTKGDAPLTVFPVGPDTPWKPLFVIPGEPS